MLRMAIFFRSS